MGLSCVCIVSFKNAQMLLGVEENVNGNLRVQVTLGSEMGIEMLQEIEWDWFHMTICWKFTKHFLVCALHVGGILVDQFVVVGFGPCSKFRSLMMGF